MGPLEVQDICSLVDWLAAKPWSTGDVGMFGVLYFARLSKAVAAMGPKPLKAIFAPFAGTDDYRHRCYHGGILAHGFVMHWRNSLHRPNYRSLFKEAYGEAAYKEHELTRGWLRASQRRLRDGGEPWEPVQSHETRESLERGKVYELKMAIVPTARLFQTGERIAIRIKGAVDEPPVNSLQALARNHLHRPRPARITIHHDENHPSHLDLPITRGNIIGTFFSGGDVSSFGLSH